MVWRYSFAESLVDKVLNHLPTSGGQISIKWVFLDVELRPNDQMMDILLNAIGPIVADDLDIGCGSAGSAS